VLDTLLMARELHPGKRNSLDALCDRYGVSNAQRTLHGALLDSELLAEVYLAMTRGQDSFAMALDDLPSGSSDAQPLHWPPKGLRVVAPSALEVSDHQAALAAIEKDRRKPSLWGTSSPA
jgi:DNA polymerase-3 subunit epsilon